MYSLSKKLLLAAAFLFGGSVTDALAACSGASPGSCVQQDDGIQRETPTLGENGGTGGSLTFKGATSGAVTIQPLGAAGSSVTLTLPNTSGTVAASASAPLVVNSTTGALSLSIGTGLTTSGNNLTLANPTASTLGGVESASASAGSYMTGINTSGVPQYARWPDRVSVADFAGADPTGSTSSSTAFNAAVTQCETLGGSTSPGCEVLVPPGSWLLSSTVTIAASNVRVHCTGSNALIINGTTSSPAITFGDGTNTYYRNGIQSCAFAQASGVTPVSTNVGLNILKQSNFVVDDIQVLNYPAALQLGIVMNSVSQSYISRIGIQNCLGNGITIQSSLDLYIRGGRSDSNGSDGWDITDSAGIYATDSSAYGNTRYAWNIFATSSHNKQFFFKDVIGDTSGSYNWAISDLTQSEFVELWGSTQSSRTVNTYATGVFLNTSAVHDITFTGGRALFNNSHGVQIYGSPSMPTNIIFNGFDFGEAANGNGQAAGGGSGLSVDNVASVVTVNGGQSIGNTTSPIALGAAATSYVTNLRGYNPVGVSAPASTGTTGATITAGASPETHYVRQSATFNAVVTKGGQTICTVPSASVPCVVELGPNESYTVGWATTQPTYTKDVH